MNAIDAEPRIRVVETEITYACADSRINRRFVAPGVEHNTGRYETHRVSVRDGRSIADQFTLDRNGFMLAKHQSAVANFFDKGEVDAIYPAEMTELVRRLTGAHCVVARGWMVRTSGDLSNHRHPTVGYTHSGGVQPPAGEAHVDFMRESAERLAKVTYARAFPNANDYSRFIAGSVWRAFSPPPQDCPLAVCDGASVAPEEGIPNTLIIVDKLPDEAAMLGDVPGESDAPAATIFPYSPHHRWWYFSNMSRDEVLLFKFYDSDQTGAWRTPHTAFHDPSFPDARTRESIELRVFAYFK
ncbi:MAG: hypothetical protein JO042_13110 [Sinobacteraceae bacterium]|nr:hypothetical protein [Nevskiaceae bacterium]